MALGIRQVFNFQPGFQDDGSGSPLVGDPGIFEGPMHRPELQTGNGFRQPGPNMARWAHLWDPLTKKQEFSGAPEGDPGVTVDRGVLTSGASCTNYQVPDISYVMSMDQDDLQLTLQQMASTMLMCASQTSGQQAEAYELGSEAIVRLAGEKGTVDKDQWMSDVQQALIQWSNVYNNPDLSGMGSGNAGQSLSAWANWLSFALPSSGVQDNIGMLLFFASQVQTSGAISQLATNIESGQWNPDPSKWSNTDVGDMSNIVGNITALFNNPPTTSQVQATADNLGKWFYDNSVVIDSDQASMLMGTQESAIGSALTMMRVLYLATFGGAKNCTSECDCNPDAPGCQTLYEYYVIAAAGAALAVAYYIYR